MQIRPLISSSLFLMLLSFAPAAAQARWDPVAFWHKRKGDIEKSVKALEAETTATVVLLGDSLTQAHPAKKLGGLPVVNQGISGDRIDVPTSGTGVRRRLELVDEARPAHVFVMIGINDIWGHKTPLPDAKSYYTEMVRELREAAPKARLYLVSVLPSTGPEADLNDEIIEMNAHVLELAKEHGLDYVDLHAKMLDDQGQLRQDLSTDGIHLTPAAYEIWTAALEEAMRIEKP